MRSLIADTGTTQAFVDRLTASPSMSGRMEASHCFLTLKQPISNGDLPSSRILKAGQKYTFPFVFTIPQQLLPRACLHQVASDFVRENHLMLPPSMGDPELSGFGGTLLDDMAPEMAKIVYGIKVRITQMHEGDAKPTLLAQKMRKVRVKPVFEEQPPLSTEGNKEYKLRLEKTIKKGLFKGKLGILTAQASQPKPIVIPGARTTDAKPITTRARIVLRFDPTDEAHLPPRLGSLKTNIKVTTFYSTVARSTFPSRATLGYEQTQGAYTDTVSLSTMCIASAQWQKHPPSANPPPFSDPIRRDSALSQCSSPSSSLLLSSIDTADIPHASPNYKNTSFYTASILVPISLPPNKNFLPTFHSCLVSRCYALSMHLSVHAAGGLPDPGVTLKVPLQVCAEGSVTGIENARVRNEEAAGALEEANRIFAPRRSRGGEDAPPEYVPFVQGRVRVVG